MAFKERLAVVELNAANEVVELLNLNDSSHYFIKPGSFKVIAPAKTRVEAVNQRRWGGAHQVGETASNGVVSWEAVVAGLNEQGAIEKVELLLAQLEANPYRLYLLWQPAGANQPTLYEVRGTGHWEPAYDVAMMEGANLWPFQLEIPVGPLAHGLPVIVGGTYYNLIPDPSFEYDTLGAFPEGNGKWGWAGTAGATHEITEAWAAEGKRSVKIRTPSDTGFRDFFSFPFLQGSGVAPGQTYTFRCVVNVLKIPAKGEIYLALYFNEVAANPEEEGKHIVDVTTASVTTTGVHTLEVTGTAPAGTGQLEALLGLANGSTAGVMELYADAFQLTTANVSYFDGSSPGAEWKGTAGDSVSVIGGALPAVFSLLDIPGDAPALAEVTIETGVAAEESFITGAHEPYGIAVNGEYVYWANSETGYIGRAKLDGTGVEETWLHTEATSVVGLAVDAGHIYWGAFPTVYIGRATLAGGSIEKTWLKAESSVTAIAVNSEHIYWTLTGGFIGRATIAGGSIEKEWLTTPSPTGLALTATDIYWTCASQNAIGRAPLAEPTKAEAHWITGASEPRGIAADSQRLYWVNEATGYLGHALLDGEEVTQSWMMVGPANYPGYLAINTEHAYITVPSQNRINRGLLTAAPVWALLGWAARPTSGLARAPFGVLDSSEATEVQGWTYEAVAGARGGDALYSAIAPSAAAFWEVDPATMVPDSFSGELTVEVWARVLLSAALGTATFTLSAQPQDGLGYGSARYTDEWGSAGPRCTSSSAACASRVSRKGRRRRASASTTACKTPMRSPR